MSRLRGRLDRLERRMPSDKPSDSDVIRVWLDLKGVFDGPASRLAALKALPRSAMRDYFLGCLDADGNHLPTPGSAEWEPPGELVYSTAPEGHRLISVTTPSRPA
jgi:hypothetical protein